MASLRTTTLQNPASKHNQEQIVCPLLGGEVAKETYKDLTYICPHSGPIRGTLVLTNYRLYFKSYESSGGDESVQDGPDRVPTVLDMPLGFISRIEKMGGHKTSGDKSYGLEIVCKDIRTLRFIMSKKPPETAPARNDIFEKIRTFSFPKNKSPFFAFQFTDRYADSHDGWKVYDPMKEFTRQKVFNNTGWRVSNANKDYKLCSTYPPVLVVPSDVSDDDLKKVAEFRSRERIPVLSWMHPESQATICRCSQPLVGARGNRSEADENMVQKIMAANAGSHRICIMDARPKVNAMANIVHGGGIRGPGDLRGRGLRVPRHPQHPRDA